MFTNALLIIAEILQCLHRNTFKSMFNHFSMFHMNNLCNRYYVSTLPRVFYVKDVIKASQSS